MLHFNFQIKPSESEFGEALFQKACEIQTPIGNITGTRHVLVKYKCIEGENLGKQVRKSIAIVKKTRTLFKIGSNVLVNNQKHKRHYIFNLLVLNHSYPHVLKKQSPSCTNE